uniref:Putative g-protein coupled receptor n=1 Tax=Ixodes ricinus TaxID=34613 RepID=A0A147BFY7_IXORI
MLELVTSPSAGLLLIFVTSLVWFPVTINASVPFPTVKELFRAPIEATRNETGVLNQNDEPGNWKFPPRCVATDSCRGRCNESRKSDDFTCHCDQLCLRYGDCCVDVHQYCVLNSTGEKNLARHPCMYDHESLPHQSFRYVSDCRDELDSIGDEKDHLGKVLGKDGIVYSNMSCARCNGAVDAVPLALLENLADDGGEQATPFVRACVVAVDTCKMASIAFRTRDLNTLCAIYQGPVRSIRRPNRKRKLYKNAYCAICNGDIPDLHCSGDVTVYSERDYSYSLFESSHQRYQEMTDDIPSAFSILLNFGLDGVQRFEFSSENKEAMLRNQQRCPENFLWDPFAELCRQIYCGTEFMLVNSRCIEKPKENIENFTKGSEEVSAEKLADYNRITVVLNVSLESDSELREEDVKQSITHALEAYNVSKERIKNVEVSITWDASQIPKLIEGSEKVVLLNEGDYPDDESNDSGESNSTYTPAYLIAHFDLYEPKRNVVEPSISSVIEAFASSLNLSSLMLKELNLTGEVSTVESRPTFIDNWCSDEDGGKIREYWNDEFALVTKPGNELSISQVYVNRTGRTYQPGDFAANVLFRVTSSQTAAVTINSVVVVCDRGTGLPESCPRLDFNLSQVKISKDDSVVLSSGTLSIHCQHYKFLPHGKVRLCLDEILDALGSRCQLFDGPLMALISLVLSVISMVALALVLLTYCLFSQLRNLPGWNVMLLTGTLFLMHLSFLLSQRQSVQGAACRAAAIVCHYCVVNSFFWMNVLAFDLYRTFTKGGAVGARKVSRFLPGYLVYAFGVPFLIVGTCVGLDYFDTRLSPYYGLFGVCWIVNRLSALTFFAVPVAVLLLLNFVFYGMTVYAVHSSARDKWGPGLRCHNERNPAAATTYLRMATGMGLTWVFGFVAVFLRSSDAARVAFTYLFIVCNTLQGLFIFYAFVCNRKVFHLYGALLRRRRARAKLSSSSSVTSVSTVSSNGSSRSAASRRVLAS